MASDTSLVFDLVARDRASAQLDSMKEKFGQASAAIGAGVAAALGTGIAANLNLGDAQATLVSQLDLTGDQASRVANLSGQVFKTGFGGGIEEVNAALSGVITGVGDLGKTSDKELKEMSVEALALAKTFELDVGESTQAAGQLIKTGLAKNGAEAFDILTQGARALPAAMRGDLPSILNEYSTQFRRVGLDGTTAMALLAQGVKGGARDIDQVADAIGQFGELALAGGKPVEEAFKSIGLNATDMAKKIGAGGPQAQMALQMTLDALRGTKNEQVKLNAATALFGDPGTVMADALFTLNPATAAAATGMDKTAGAADRMTKNLNSPALQLEKLKRVAMTELAEIGGHVVKFAMDHETYMKPVAITLGVIAATVLAVKAGMLAWSAAQAVWTAATTVATGAQWLWNAALAASPITLTIIAVLALAAVFVVLWQRSETMRAIVTGAWSAIWGFLQAIGGWFTGSFVPWVTGAWSAISGGASKLGRDIQGMWNGLVGWLSGLPGRVTGAVRGMWDAIPGGFKAALNGVIGKWNGLSFKVGGGSFMGVSIPSFTLSTPDIPYLAKGGHIMRAGTAMVGERGPELVHLPTGASVTPLTRGGGMGGAVRVIFDFTGADGDMKRFIRRIVRVDGRGSVQVAFGSS